MITAASHTIVATDVPVDPQDLGYVHCLWSLLFLPKEVPDVRTQASEEIKLHKVEAESATLSTLAGFGFRFRLAAAPSKFAHIVCRRSHTECVVCGGIREGYYAMKGRLYQPVSVFETEAFYQ